MKIGIITIQSLNYGNRLQNYALQTVLQEFGYEVESVRREPYGLATMVKRAIRSRLKDDLVEKFRSFDSELMHFSDKSLCGNPKSTLSPSDYDMYVIGSDQVWNPTFDFNGDDDYLPMVPPDKKVAYAASFGVSKIASDRYKTAQLLNGIPQISMRERSGADIIRELTAREVPVVADPTLLLEMGTWAEVGRRPDWMDSSRSYVFKYFLGNDAYDRAVAQLAEERSCEVVDVMDRSLKIGPREFVWLVQNCLVACTDSFHASVFSLMAHVPLIIFERMDGEADMSSRFDTLCEEFALAGHRFSQTGFSLDAVFDTDWSAFESRLRDLRDRSMKWLEGALGVESGVSKRA